MGTPQSLQLQLAEYLRFDPGWIKDPVPWILPHLDRSTVFEVARIHTEFQKSVQVAHTRALEQFQSVLNKGLGAK